MSEEWKRVNERKKPTLINAKKKKKLKQEVKNHLTKNNIYTLALNTKTHFLVLKESGHLLSNYDCKTLK